MVAAAGEGAGLAPRIAVTVFAGVIVGVLLITFFTIQSSALEMLHGPFPPEVLLQKAKDAIQRLGYDTNTADDAHGFGWYDYY